MRRQLLLFILLMVGSELAIGQRSNSYKNIENFNVGYSLGVHFGTQGFGLNGAYAPTEMVRFGLATSIAPVGLNETKNWGEHRYIVDMDARFFNVQAVVEIRPLRWASDRGLLKHLALVGGVGYFFSAKAKARAVPGEIYHFGELEIPIKELGSVSADIKWKGIAPYLGTGIKQIYFSGALTLNLDIGTYYLAAPDVSMAADKMLSESASNEATVRQNMKTYRWLPVLQFGIAYGL